VFLILVVWSLPCCLLLRELCAGPSVPLFLATASFLVAWAGLAARTLRDLTGWEHLSVDAQGLAYELRIFVRLVHWRLPAHAVVQVQVVKSAPDGFEEGDWLIEIQTEKRSIRVSVGSEPEEAERLARAIRNQLGFGRHAEASTPAEASEPAQDSSKPSPTPTDAAAPPAKDSANWLNQRPSFRASG
jgi:hypothetical protein